MYIKIIQCSDKTHWYNNHIGKVCEVKFWDEYSSSYVIDNIDGTGKTMGSVFEGDFEKVEEFNEEDLFIPPTPPKEENEIRIEDVENELKKTKNELELTQNALNEILMNIMMGGV